MKPTPTKAAGTLSCAEALEHSRAFLEGGLEPVQLQLLEAHLRQCTACRQEVEARRKVVQLLGAAFNGTRISGQFEAEATKRLSSMRQTGSAPRVGVASTGPLPVLNGGTAAEDDAARAGLTQRMGAAPWWGVSVCLHVLAILLASLVTMTIGTLEQADEIIVVTNIEKRPEAKADEPEKTKPTLRDILESKDVPATDAASTQQSNIVVPPDILAKAELGDHFETINPDRPDTQSAFGNPDARMFHSVEGNDEPEGGGGSGGNSLMDSLIGVGGSASPGTGGGWGGGNGTGTGIGTGSGHGSFGSRTGGGRRLMVMKHGGSKASESAVDKALEWLARHQEADGHWDSKKHGVVHAACDTGMAGYALLAFLGAGHTEKVGKYRDNVKRGVEWLIKKQAENGCLASQAENVGYNHPIAGMALAEAAGMGRDSYTKEAAQKALEYSVNIHQCGDGSDKRGWRYGIKQEPSDLSVSGWFVMQLKSAKVAGLKVPHGGFEGAEWFLNHVEDKTFAKDANDPYDNGRHRYGYEVAAGQVTYTRTAIGILCRQFMGAKPEELQGGVEWFVKTGGLPSKNVVLLYYWYYGTLCTFQQGGDVWKKWNDALKPTLLDSQCKGGVNDGSWDYAGTAYGESWGRVGSTALSAMCLEVYYRYLPMYR